MREPIEFRRTLELNTDAESVFQWHVRPGAFERLGPPWERVELDGRAARIEPGEKQTVLFRLGPLERPWSSEITSVTPGRAFEDVQLEGPFASWTHTHSMEPAGAGSTLEDKVEYTLPLGALGSLFGGGFVRRKLDRMFAYRHRVTADDLLRHAEAGVAPMRVLVSGASGLVGRSLVSFLTTGGHEVRRLVRREPTAADEFYWNPERGGLDPKALDGVDAVVHLAGENIAGARWSAAHKKRVLESRVTGTRTLAEAIGAHAEKPRVFVSASAIGIHGDRGDEALNEESSAGTGFLAEVCEAWEREARVVEDVRSVQLRFGVILTPAGGALERMLLPFQLGGGGKIGSGRQWMSWIALDDAVGAIYHAITRDSLEGAVNAVAPEPATNKDYTRTLGRVLRRPTIFPMPAFVARLTFGELADELLLASQKVTPTRLLDTGYRYAQPELEGALRHQLGR